MEQEIELLKPGTRLLVYKQRLNSLPTIIIIDTFSLLETPRLMLKLCCLALPESF